MQKLWKWMAIALGALLALLLIGQLVGMSLPREHVATSRARYEQPPEVVYDVLADHAGSASWRPGLVKVVRLPDEDGKPVWREEGEFGAMAIRVDVAERPTLYTTTIADDELPFGGSWTFRIEPLDDGRACRLTITEDGFIEPGFFRFLSRFVFGYNATKDQYMVDLGLGLGEEVTPEHVEG